MYYLYFVRIGWYSFSPPQFPRGTAPAPRCVSAPDRGRTAGRRRPAPRLPRPPVLLPLALGITWLSSMYFNAVLQLAVPNAAFPYGDRVFTSYLVYYLAG